LDFCTSSMHSSARLHSRPPCPARRTSEPLKFARLEAHEHIARAHVVTELHRNVSDDAGNFAADFGLFGRLQRSCRHRQRRSGAADRKSTRLNSSHVSISYAVFCLKKKKDK